LNPDSRTEERDDLFDDALLVKSMKIERALRWQNGGHERLWRSAPAAIFLGERRAPELAIGMHLAERFDRAKHVGLPAVVLSDEDVELAAPVDQEPVAPETAVIGEPDHQKP
jgi:hypothetical protein